MKDHLDAARLTLSLIWPGQSIYEQNRIISRLAHQTTPGQRADLMAEVLETQRRLAQELLAINERLNVLQKASITAKVSDRKAMG